MIKNKKKSHQKNYRPAISSFETMDELVLVPIEKVIDNLDLPIFSTDTYSKFDTTEEYMDIVRSGDFQQKVQMGPLTIRFPEMFDTIYVKMTDGRVFQYFVIKDKGSSLRVTCYDYYTPEDEKQVKMAGSLIGLQMDNDYIWSYEIHGREMKFEPVFTKSGRHFATSIVNSEIKLNRSHPTFALVYSALRDKKLGQMDSFRRKMSIITQDASWRPIDIEALCDEDIEYSEKMIQVALSVDAAVFFVQYAFTCHMIANRKDYGIEIESEIEAKSAGYAKPSMTQSGKKSCKVVHSINIDLHKKSLKKVRAIRDRAAAQYSASSWEVRGYKRKYKSGKEVWIKPTTKKRKEDLLKATEGNVRKQYKVKI